MSLFFFFNDTATTEIYPLSLHDALPICAPDRLSGLGLRPPAELGADALVAVRIRTRHEGRRGARQSAGGEQAEREAGERCGNRNRPGAPAERGPKRGEELALRQRGRRVARHVVCAEPLKRRVQRGDGGG